MDHSTHALITGFLHGRSEDVRAFVQRMSKELPVRIRRQKLWKILRNKVEIEDLVQEVIWRALSTGLLERIDDRGPGSVMRVLSVVVDRTLVDVQRRFSAGKRHPTQGSLLLDSGAVEAAIAKRPEETSSATPTGEARATDLVDFCLRHLTGREQAVWQLIEVDGLDAEEAARRLGITSSAVRGVLMRARTRLARLLRGDATNS